MIFSGITTLGAKTLGAIAALTDTIKLGTAIVQLDTRTPAMLAMSAMSLQQLSGGRFLLGVGASGPQVMEGWHGVPFAKPVRRTRETIEIIRMITAGERLVYDGEMYQLPLPGGEGKALRAAAPGTSRTHRTRCARPMQKHALRGPWFLRQPQATSMWIPLSWLCRSRRPKPMTRFTSRHSSRYGAFSAGNRRTARGRRRSTVRARCFRPRSRTGHSTT